MKPSIASISSFEDNSVTTIPLSLINFFLFIFSIAIFVKEKFLYGGSEKIKSSDFLNLKLILVASHFFTWALVFQDLGLLSSL
ncbi:MAG: hypothetical protein CM15mP109_15840 [Candidatus Dadabacteria bacterium]|nr:MAG: hypothetical protein CM15mP109_15840 [Candidatus Dadabacteria bacterium]